MEDKNFEIIQTENNKGKKVTKAYIIYGTQPKETICKLLEFQKKRGRRGNKQTKKKVSAFSKSSAMKDMAGAVAESAEILLKVGGFLMLFGIVRKWTSMGWFGDNLGGIGVLLEVTGGVKNIVQQNWDRKWILAGCSALLNFSGFCVILQSMGTMEKVPVSFTRFLLCKTLQGVLAGGITLGICQILQM